MANPVGFGSPMGGGGGDGNGVKAWKALVTELSKAVTASKTIKDNMEAAAKAATSIAKGNGGLLGQGIPASGSTGNGGGARMPTPPGRHWISQQPGNSPISPVPYRPAGFGGGMGAQLPLGGGAAMPAQPGRSYQDTMAASNNIIAQAGGTPNGGGAGMPAFAKKALVSIGGAAAVSMADLGNARSMDWLANRSARIANGGYNKTTAGDALMGQFANSFRSHQEREAAIMPLINRGGFTSNSAGFNTMASSVRSMAALNPMMGGAQAANAQLGFQGPQAINMSRVNFGFSTVGAGGRPRSVADISQDLMRSVAGGRLLNQTQLAGEMGQTGMLRVNMQRAGFNEDMQQAIQDYLTESAGAGRYLSDNEIQRRKGPGSDTIMGAEQETATSKAGVLNSYLEEYADAFAGMSDRINAALDAAAASIERIPGAAAAIGTAAGGSAALTNSGPVGAALGAAALATGGVTVARGRRASRVARAGGAGRGRAALTGLRGAARFAGPIGAAVLGAEALYYGYRGIQGARAEGNGTDIQAMWEHGLGGEFGYERGDGYGGRRGKQISTAGSGWGGISQPEIGDSDKGEGGGRGNRTLQFLENLIKSSGLPHRITSRVRGNARTTSGNLSYHATGHALDIAGPTPGVDTEDMLKINKYLAQKLGQGAQELIYSGPGAVNLHGGKPHQYGAAVRKLHHNHVHVAVTEASLKRIGKRVEGGTGSGAGATAGAAAGRSSGKGGPTEGVDYGGKGRRFRLGAGRFSERRLISDILGNLNASARGEPRGVDPSEASSDAASTGVGSAGASVGAHAIDKFLAGLRDKESGGDYQAENGGTRGARGGGDTSASGAYQYVDGTWGNYKGYKYAAAAPPNIQDERARADMHRLYSKYGNWRNVAAAHFQGEGFAAKNTDPSTWKPHVQGYVKDVLSRAGLPESGDGYGMPTAGWTGISQPEMGDGVGGGSGGGGSATMNVRGGSSIRIDKVEVHLTTPQVSKAEAERIGKMVADQIARKARMQAVSS